MQALFQEATQPVRGLFRCSDWASEENLLMTPPLIFPILCSARRSRLGISLQYYSLFDPYSVILFEHHGRPP